MILKTMFKNTLALAMAVISGLAAQAQHKFTINGELAKDKQGTIFLKYQKHGIWTTDSARVTSGAFQLKGEIGDPCPASLELNPQKGPIKSQEMLAKIDVQTFFLEGTVMTVKSAGGVRTAAISGGKSQAELLIRNATLNVFGEQYNNLGKQYKEGMSDTALLRLKNQGIQIKLKSKQADSVFIKNYPDSYVAFNLWNSKLRTIAYLYSDTEFNHFTPKIQNSDEGKKTALKVALGKKLDVGNMAPDFILKDTLGHEVSLTSLKGKNVLVSFYSENFMGYETFAFNLGRINRRLKDKNFVMVTVYYDNGNKNTNTIEHWKSVIERSSFNWLNLEDLGGYNKDGVVSPTAKAYGITSSLMLPLAFLIGPDGRILAKTPNLGDNDLGKKIEAMLK